MVLEQSIHADYEYARRKAAWRSLLMRLVRRRNALLRFDAVRRRVRGQQGRRMPGIQQVDLDAIVGSVGRYHDFDAAFLPRRAQTRPRWVSINRAHYEDITLPPVELYSLGNTYFVKDGNHRVSVARERGQKFIDAVVTEVACPVPIESLDDLEKWLEQQDLVEFLATTRLLELRPEADVRLSLCGQAEKLLEHISVHRWFLGEEVGRAVTYEDAVISWYDRVFVPVVEAIRETQIAREFPGRTVADLYVWLIEHIWYLHEASQFGDDVALRDAARQFASSFSTRRVRRLGRAVRKLIRQVA
jgi:hypothetical protein